MEDLVVDLTRGNPSSVKTVLASVVLALAVYQLLLAAIGYRKLPVGKPGPAFFRCFVRVGGEVHRGSWIVIPAQQT